MARALSYVTLVLSLLLAACGSESKDRNSGDLPSYSALKHVYQAPVAVQKAAEAVVMVGTPDGQGTAFFVDPHGLLMTNHHVLGSNENTSRCAKEGCWVTLTTDFRMDRKFEEHEVFLTPVAGNRGLDATLFQVWDKSDPATRKEWSSPKHLTVAATTNLVAVNSVVHGIGHHSASLQRWTTGRVTRSETNWFQSNLLSMRGSSGSPIVNDAGTLVGILHSGLDDVEWIAGKDLRVFTWGTHTKSLAELVAGGRSTARFPSVVRGIPPMRSAEKWHSTYLMAREPNVNFPTGVKPVVDVVAELCDAAIAGDPPSRKDFKETYAACGAVRLWWNCRDPEVGKGYKSCPDEPGKVAWTKRFLDVSVIAEDLRQDDLLGWVVAPRDLGISPEDSGDRQRKALDAYIARSKPTLNFDLAVALLYFSDKPATLEYDGVPLASYVRNFWRTPHYEFEYAEIIDGLFDLWDEKLLASDPARNTSALISLLERIISDKKLTVVERLRLDARMYRNKLSGAMSAL